MRKAKIFLGVLFFLSPLVVFGDDGLLQQLQATHGGDFAGSEDIARILGVGTTAQVQSFTQPFASANFGVQVKVLSPGPLQNKSVWIDYNQSQPGLKSYKSQADLQSGKAASGPAPGGIIQTTQPLHVYADPGSVSAADLVSKIDTGNKAVKSLSTPGGACPDCPLAQATSSAGIDPRDEHINQESPSLSTPQSDANSGSGGGKRCGGSGDIETCIFDGQTDSTFFDLLNRGPNSIVTSSPRNDVIIGRTWAFSYEGKARQDMYMQVTDEPSESNSDGQNSVIMLFPRTTVPSMRVEGSHKIVTLPTGETITYGPGNQVISGVFSEDGSISSSTRKLSPPKLTYKGSGVMVRIDNVGEDPRYAKTATITKQGRSCKVPASSLWPDRSQESALHFKYASDSEFSSFLMKTCGFGI